MGNRHFFRRDLLKASMALAAEGLFPASLKAARPVVIGPSVGSAEARARERYHRSRAAEQRDEL